MGTYCWCVHALQTSTLCEGSGTHRPLLVYRFSAASLHNCMPDSFSLDTYHLEHICEDTQYRIFELCSSRGGLRFTPRCARSRKGLERGSWASGGSNDESQAALAFSVLPMITVHTHISRMLVSFALRACLCRSRFAHGCVVRASRTFPQQVRFAHLAQPEVIRIT